GTEVAPEGQSLGYSTYLGGEGEDVGLGIAVDAAGDTYVTGDTASGDFPTTPAAFDTTPNGGVDAFVTKLAAALSVSIEVRPGGETSPINLKSRGVVPVAILSTASFDATTVDPTSVCFGDAEDPGRRGSTPLLRRGVTIALTGDHRRDLLLFFQTQQTGIDPGDTEACLTGTTREGAQIQGCDAIRTR